MDPNWMMSASASAHRSYSAAAVATASSQKRPLEQSATPLRTAAGEVWQDPTLADWDPNDFRIFVANLGTEVNDQTLHNAFAQYKSLARARVIRDKKTNKSKGYGFVSFGAASDFTRVLKEMDGKYIGSKPVQLKKSNWKDRNIAPQQTKKTRIIQQPKLKLPPKLPK